MLFAFFCTDHPNRLDVRLANRPAHVDHLRSQGDKLLFAGPTLADDGETMNGSLVVLDLADRAEAEAFAANDPYARAGLFQSVVIRPWKKVLPP
ncbi:MAG: YciI family protein [Alphaproteobacteria bacterium]|nr:YciI family protein [Alphaproteobacteria bacterium]